MSNAPTASVARCWAEIGVMGQGDRSCEHLAEMRHCRHCPVYRAAGRSLLDRPLSDEARAEWTRAVAAPPPAHDRSTRSAMVFRLGTEWMALPALSCEEVTSDRPMLRLPHYRRGEVGLVNIHGRLEICVPLARVLGVEEPASDGDAVAGARRIIVVARGAERFALPVSQVHGAARYRASGLQPVPDTVARSPASFAAGFFEGFGRRVLCLDPDLLFPALGRCLA